MPSDCCLHQVIQLGFQIFEDDFSSSCNKCLALQCTEVVVCSTAFFIKVSLFLKIHPPPTPPPHRQKKNVFSGKLLSLIIIVTISVVHIVHHSVLT